MFSCVPIGGGRAQLLAKDATGWPCVLLELPPNERPDPAVVGVSLRHLVVEPRVRCRIDIGDVVTVDEYALIRCVDATEELMTYFVAMMDGLLGNVSGPIDGNDVVVFVTRLVDLVAALDSPPAGTIAGLWGELYVAMSSSAPDLALGAWHANPMERFDFARGELTDEVKTFRSPD